MESEANENNNYIHKVDKHQHNETNLNKSNDKTEHTLLQQKSSSSDDDQDIVSPPAHHSDNKVVSQEVVPSEPGLTKIQNGSQSDGHVHQNKEHAEHRKDAEPHSQEGPGGNSDGKVRSTDGLTYEPSDNDSEPEGEYSFTEDQKRAMMELMVQKHEDGDIIDEDPPEYNVKGRLILLNAELANDPIPIEGNRETKVGFKPEIVDLVAPPPSYLSDDESQPDSGRSDKQKPSDKEMPSPGADNPQKVSEQKEGMKKPNNESYVVERDGNFSVLTAKELTPSEYELYASKEDKDKNDKSSNKDSGVQRIQSDDKVLAQGHRIQGTVAPRPPSKPRPNTAVSGPRRATGQSARPKSAAPVPQHDNSSLHNFDYNSPYALTKEQKEEAKREAKRVEEERQEQERRKKEEDEEKQKENMSAFKAWLKKKREDKNKKQESEHDDEQQKEEREAAYKTWLKEKHAQGKREKLLRRRQQQERSGSCVVRTQEDCDKAFREWLKRKNLETKKQMALEKQKCKFYKLNQRRSKRTLALLKALKIQSGSPYLDYYGYRI